VSDSQFGLSGREENILPLLEFKPLTLQSVAYPLYYHCRW